MRLAPFAGSLVLLAALAACGTETAEPPAGEGGAWTKEVLRGESGADSPVGMSTSGDDVIVAMVDDRGTVQTHVSVSGGRFTAGDPIATDSRYAQFADPVRHGDSWVLMGSGGLVEDGDDETFLYEPTVLRSDDGLEWTRQATTGFSAPVEFDEVMSVDGFLVAVGSYRLADEPAMGGFRAMAWRSADGAAWTEAPLPGGVPEPTYETDSYAGHLVVVGDKLVAGGAVSGDGALWSSEDAGESWHRVAAPQVDELYGVSGLAAAGQTLVVSGSTDDTEAEGSVLLVSTDGGATWGRPEQPPPGQGEGFAPLWEAGVFVTWADPVGDLAYEPGACYADPDQCTDREDTAMVYTSEDGNDWTPLDTTGATASDELAGMVGTDDGRFLLAEVTGRGVTMHTWPGDAELPVGEEAAGPETVELVTVPEGEDPEPGVRYHAPLYTHCGMDWLYLGDRPWQRTDGGPEVGTGGMIYGYATLVDGGVVEYTTEDGEVIATYEQTGAEPPGCD